MDAIRFKPRAIYPLDDIAPYDDYSGYANAGTQTGTSSKGIALTANTDYSRQFHATSTGSFAAPVYTTGRESAPFSIAVTLFPIINSNTTEQQVASHDTNFDGITVEGTVVHFSTKYVNTGEARCSYDVGEIRKLDVVGVHTQTKNSLYIDSLLVAETDITEQQQVDTYDITDPNFRAGYTTGDQRVLLNNLGFFPRALRKEEILSMHRSNRAIFEGSVARAFGGTEILLGENTRPPFIDTTWSTDIDWETAEFYNAVTDNDQLHASMSDGLTLGGFWIDSLDLYNGDLPEPILSLDIDWEGVNAIVEASLDAESWTVVTKGVPFINSSTDPTDKALYIRVTFAANETEAYLEWMRVRAYNTNTGIYNNMPITYSNAVQYMDNHPATLAETGVRLDNGSIVIDRSDDPIRTVEIWMKRNGVMPTLSANLGATTYINGESGTAHLQGEWVVKHFVSDTDIAGDISISGSLTVAKIVFYPTALAAADISKIVTNYTGKTVTSYSAGSISILEPVDSATIYAYDWEFVAS